MSYILPIGPYHPALEEPVHAKLYTEGEVIKDAEVFVGYNHRGIEKLATERNAIQTLVLVERVCGICSHSHAMTYAMAVEAINGVENMLYFSSQSTGDGSYIKPLGSAVSGRILIGLGASTGGTEATLEVMKRLPADIPGMLIVQHMPVGFTKMYAERLNKLCKMEVREAKDGDDVRRGLALIAPADLQMRVLRSPLGGYKVSCTNGERVSGHRPSVDALFFSMAENVRCPMIGIIMTGMGRDGADGLLAMRRKGAYTIGQDRETSVVYGMPGVAHEIGAVMVQAACKDIANVLLRRLQSR